MIERCAHHPRKNGIENEKYHTKCVHEGRAQMENMKLKLNQMVFSRFLLIPYEHRCVHRMKLGIDLVLAPALDAVHGVQRLRSFTDTNWSALANIVRIKSNVYI